MIRGWRTLARGLAVWASLVGASLGGAARAEILSADLEVNGLVCPFCAFGIEKKLLDVDGVTKVEVLLDEGRLHLELAPANAATPAGLEAAVEAAGFELAGLAIEARGTLAFERDQTWLEAHEGLRLRLLERDGDGERPLSPAARERLRADGQGRAVVSGRVLGRGDSLRLVVDPEANAARGRA